MPQVRGNPQRPEGPGHTRTTMHRRSQQNKVCRYCKKEYESMAKRINHEGACAQRPTQADGDSLIWECTCGWQLINSRDRDERRLEETRQRHLAYCRGSMTANVTCQHCGKTWPAIVANQAHESRCRGGELEQRTCKCCNRVFNKIDTCRKHERQMRNR